MIMLGVGHGLRECGSRRILAGVCRVGGVGSASLCSVAGCPGRGCGVEGQAWAPWRVAVVGPGSGMHCGLAETGPFGGVPGAEEPAEGGLVADESDGDAAGPADDHRGDENDAGQGTAELHADVVVPGALAVD